MDIAAAVGRKKDSAGAHEFLGAMLPEIQPYSNLINSLL